MAWVRKNYLSPEDEAIRAMLAAQVVDEKAAAKHIRAACEDIQATWSEADERNRRNGNKLESLVEIKVVSEGDHVRNREPGITRR